MSDCGIYSILNTKNNRRYVGQSRRISTRKDQHFRQLLARKHNNELLQNACNVHGIGSFEFEILELVEYPDDLDAREIHWITHYNSCKDGYNKTSGGSGDTSVSEITKLRMALSQNKRHGNTSYAKTLKRQLKKLVKETQKLDKPPKEKKVPYLVWMRLRPRVPPRNPNDPLLIPREDRDLPLPEFAEKPPVPHVPLIPREERDLPFLDYFKPTEPKEATTPNPI